MLSPETLATLEQALNAVIEEAGDDPQLEELVAQLEQARDAIPAGDEGPPADEAAEEAPDDEEERDPFSFEDAEKEWGRRKKAAKKKPPAEEADAEDEDV